MRIRQFDILPLQREACHLGKLKGLLIHLVTEEGKEGFGEVSLLPGRSMESVEECQESLLQIKQAFINQTLSGFTLPPSVKFGLWSALSDLQQEDVDDVFKCTKLCFPDDPYYEGAAHVKIKVSEDLGKTERLIRKYIDQKTKVRIDLNYKLPFSKAVEFCNRFEEGEIEYVEDPVALKILPEFLAKTHINIALDEPVPANRIDTLFKLERITHVIIKPSLIGGLEECRKIAVEAERHKRVVVLSSSFESLVGLSSIVRLGRQLNISEPLGIDTLKYEKSPLIKAQETFIEGQFNTSKIKEWASHELLSCC